MNLLVSMSSKCSCLTHWVRNKKKTISSDKNYSKLLFSSMQSINFTASEPLMKTTKLSSLIMNGSMEKKISTSLDTDWRYAAKVKRFCSELWTIMESLIWTFVYKERLIYIRIILSLQTIIHKFKPNMSNT